MKPFCQYQLQQRLDENNLAYTIVALQDGVSLLLSQQGGRILGPFLSPESASLYWLNDVWKDADAFCDFIAEKRWNLGGERIWIAPEIQYNIHDRRDFWGSYHLPPQMDPGQHQLKRLDEATWQFQQELTLNAYNLAHGPKALTVTRLIRPTANPLGSVSDRDTLMMGVQYAGYEHSITLTDEAPNEIISATWSLIQLIPGGKVLIPASPSIESVFYMHPVDENFQEMKNGHICVPITGNSQFKVGYMAAHVYGRVAYAQSLPDGRVALIIRNFYNNPSAVYPEEPANLPGRTGQSIFIYNDDGNLGGFGELECLGQAIGGQSGIYSQTDKMHIWLYVGDTQQIDTISRNLLGFSVNN